MPRRDSWLVAKRFPEGSLGFNWRIRFCGGGLELGAVPGRPHFNPHADESSIGLARLARLAVLAGLFSASDRVEARDVHNKYLMHGADQRGGLSQTSLRGSIRAVKIYIAFT